MKILKWLLGIVLVLAAVLLLGGLALPSKFTVQRSVRTSAPPEKVYPLVADPRGWKQWSVWNRRDPAMQITYSGPPAGTGAVWEWKSQSEGDGRMTITAADPALRVAFDLYFPDFGTTSQGELRFAVADGSTQIVWVMNGDLGKNPLMHWMSLFMDRMIGKDFDDGLANLKAVAEAK
jgi:uncharacterized protein YndB with AHSA1/START domain